MSGSPSFHVAQHPSVPAALRNGYVAIGNFDGVHRGHQAVLSAAVDRAGREGRPAVMLTFEPHPRDVFQPDEPVFRLTPPSAKARVAAELGLAGLVTVDFSTDFAARSADSFVADVLVAGLGVHGVTVGWDFHYGAGRRGTPALLVEEGARLGFSVDVVEPFQDEGGVLVSSSRIRTLIAEGALAEAAGLLGYRWFFEGEVVHGEKRGRTIGYPTANLRLPAAVRLPHGIYAVVIVIDGERHHGVASFGRRPTFDNGAPAFETFVFDFSGDLYGKTVTVTPVSYLRPEMKFDSVDALVAQMDRDSAEARAVLQSMQPVGPLDRALLLG